MEKCGETERIEFSFEGIDENDPVSGRGWAVVKEGRLEGKIYFHLGGHSWFKADKSG